MEQLSMCRMCLADDVPMRCMENKYLQAIFEKITDIPFVREDRPIVACYICCAKLLNCFKFRNNCLQSEGLLQQMYNANSLFPVKKEVKHLVTAQMFCTMEVLNLSCSGVDADTINIHVEGLSSMIADAEVKQEIIEASTNESLQGFEEQNSYYKTKADGITKEVAKSMDTSEPQGILTNIKTEKLDNNTEDDIIRWSDTEVDTPNDRKLSHNIPLKTLRIVLSRCDDIIYEKQAHRRITQSQSSENSSCDKKKIQEAIKRSVDETSRKQPKEICARGAQTYQCDSCKSHFNVKTQLIAHLRICNTSFTSFIQKSDVIGHKQTNDKPHKCDFCNQLFNFKSILVICNFCSKTFNGKYNLIQRNIINTDNWKCNICNKSFSNKSDLITHTRIHTIRPYKCKVCGKSFHRKFNLAGHKLIHSEERPYKCNICNKSFKRNSHLIKHKLIHSEERPYICDICYKSFKEKYYLKIHIVRTHTNERPYECYLCGKSFKEKCDLVRHERLHTGQKPYECDVCKKAFAHNSYLAKHKRIHSGLKRYECNHCTKSFTRKQHLDTHNRIHTVDN